MLSSRREDMRNVPPDLQSLAEAQRKEMHGDTLMHLRSIANTHGRTGIVKSKRKGDFLAYG